MMMIRINLLPTRQVKKREMSKQLLALAATILVGTCVGNYLWYASREEVRVKNDNQLRAIESNVADLQKKIGEVDKLNSRKKEVEEKLTVLANLKKGRSGPVKMMDALSTATPKKVWLTSMNEAGGRTLLKGTALSHEDVAELMRSLTNVVWTPKGIGRLVEQRKDSKSSRVELTSGEGVLDDFPVGDVKFFFANIDLKGAEQRDEREKNSNNVFRTVDFEIELITNYAI